MLVSCLAYNISLKLEPFMYFLCIIIVSELVIRMMGGRDNEEEEIVEGKQ
jgi:hypothetical protein